MTAATRSVPPTRSRFLVGLLALIGVSTLFWLLVWATVPTIMGWKPVAVTSGSMAPLIRSGDVVVAAPHSDDRLGPGTIIVFEDSAGNGLVTHRIVAVTPSGEYVTSGDANPRSDSTPVRPDQVVGVGRLLVPLVGNPLVWAWQANWAQLILAAGVLAAALWCSRWALLDRFDPWTMPPPDPDVGPEQQPQDPVLPKVSKGLLLLLFIAVIVNATPARGAFATTTSNSANSFTAASSFGPSVFYLHNDPTPPTGDTASHTVLPFDTATPTVSVLYNYDTDRDGDAGLLLNKSGSGLSETDPTKHQIWSLDGSLDLDGNAELTLWSAIKSFDTSNRGVVLAALLDCASDGSDCNTITIGSLDLDPWDSTNSGTWLEKTIDLGTVTHTISAARTLRIKIVVGDNSGDDMWFAYDTTSYDSHLQIGS